MTNETSSATPSSPSDSTKTDSDNAGAEELRTPLRTALTESADTAALRDELSGVQSSGSRAAYLSGEHFSRLLYGPGADDHISPYGVPPVPNSLDSREK
ncbi:MAG TPA: hypothetical protein VKQ30_08770 [Ktedonobacterales bacterium]|nr:hypothetical protein [Ktedonobacterales bacterium]